jgi:hypothetical protein
VPEANKEEVTVKMTSLTVTRTQIKGKNEELQRESTSGQDRITVSMLKELRALV